MFVFLSHQSRSSRPVEHKTFNDDGFCSDGFEDVQRVKIVWEKIEYVSDLFDN